MKLSIIVPVYRSEATLDRCLQSLMRQDITDYEVILVDDGSPDGCPQLCDEWAAKDSHSEWFTNLTVDSATPAMPPSVWHRANG